MRRRVVITGLGVCTGVGRGAGRFWNNLTAGRSGISPVSVFDASTLPVRIGGEVKELPLEQMAGQVPEAAGERDRKIWLGLDAVAQALADAGAGGIDLRNTPLFVGVSLETFFLDDVVSLTGKENSSLALRGVLAKADAPRLQTPLDLPAQIIADHYGLNGERYTNCSACVAGTQAIGEAFRAIRAGAAEAAVAGATDSVLNPLAMGGFSLLQILSTENDRPEQACRPFDATRQGTVLGEGAAFLVMEELGQARRRGARVYAEVLGYGASLDAYRVTDPEPNGHGAALSMTRAIADAGLMSEAIDCVNAHATGTRKNDVAETRAIKRALGARAYEIPITANKSMTGHLIAASGTVEAAASTLTLYTGKMPPTINLSTPDPECDLDYVPKTSREFTGRTVLTNSFGFGGQNAALVLGKFEL
jgi:3-oxoacyl-[acyl-carrier-protein] synthase II